MKKTVHIIAIFLVSTLYGQQISEFQYIAIPQKFKDAKANNYDLDALLSKNLKAKKYSIIREDGAQIENPCEILTAEITDTSNFFKNKIRVDFLDCNNKNIATLESLSSIKDFDEGMRDALQNVSNKIPVANPVKHQFAAEKQKVTYNSKTEVPVKRSEIAVIVNKKKDADSAKSAEIKEAYTNGFVTLIKVEISAGEFILLNPTTYQTYATFKPASKKETYRVHLENGTSTLGYLEDGKIIIEMQNADGTFKNDIFQKK